MAKSFPAQSPLGSSFGFAGRRFSAISSKIMDNEGKRGGDVAAKESSTRLERESHIAALEPLTIPEYIPDMADTIDLEPDPLSVHPGDRMVIDSDKPHWTPTISVFSPSRRTSIASNFSPGFAPSIAPSTSSGGSTLVDNASILSGKTTSTSYDVYGWEEGLDRKMQLEAKVNLETIPGIHSLYPYQQSKHERGLLYRVLNPPPMHH
jgi:hypothetical protein